ncbi:hypothetical protein [Alicyclobacillus ferrooxydans]|uniref:Glutamine synthetase n=1 Tax=Alicyclobacillus ferrooxydans TaxID=471514 RepID=A0A0P9D419_9BACL|nr:hypothetical protein [Alicyclobacillus ferrooxydans]KPV44244.1 hypothetical protein AN477_08060 [Alicyclobacillus ferrooxydans]
MKYDRDAVLMMAQSENVRYIRLQFTDLLGNLKNVEVLEGPGERNLRVEPEHGSRSLAAGPVLVGAYLASGP